MYYISMKFDVAVIGGGPAGLSASIYTTRAGLNTICFEKLAVGGQAVLSYDITNYPGFESITGFDLTQKMFKQAKNCGTEFTYESVLKIKKLKTGFSIKTKNKTYQSKKIIIACGTVNRQLGLNEAQFVGKGVSYCASCDGNFFKGKTVCVVGGGDSAFVYLEYLSRLCSKVYLIHRSEQFKAQKYRIDKAKTLKNVEFVLNANIVQLNGEEKLKSIEIKVNNTTKTIEAEGLFVAIGHMAKCDFLDFEIKTDKAGFIVVDKNMQTSEKDVYACGDIISKHFKQIVTACADGAIAGNSCIGG